ncbi:MAG: hypothetical protein AAF798_12280 [Bacteroidota bacterium]
MTRFLTTCLFVSLVTMSFGQTITVSEQVSLRNDNEYQIIGEYNGQTLLYQEKRPDYFIIGFDEAMQQSWEKELELDRKQPSVLGVMRGDTSFNVLYRFRKKGHTILKVNQYDPGANLLDSASVVDLGYMLYTPNLQVIRSEDRSKLLVYYTENRTTFNLYVFDVDSLATLWDRSVRIDDVEINREFDQILVDNNGQVTIVLDKNNFRSKRESHYYEVHRFRGEKSDDQKFIIPMTNYVTYDVKFDIDNLNDRLLAAGLYSQKSAMRVRGYFYLNVPAQNPKEHLLRFEEFDKKFIELILGKKVKKNKGFENAMVNDLVLRRDGGVLMITERTKRFERRNGNNSRVFYDPYNRFITDYYFDEIIVISIHPTGETHWRTVLHKKQYSQDDDAVYSSFFLMKTPSSLRFLYNDEIKYENTVSEYVLRGDGHYDRNSMLSTEDLEIRLRFRDAIQVGSDRIIVPSERRNRLKLVRVQY